MDFHEKIRQIATFTCFDFLNNRIPIQVRFDYRWIFTRNTCQIAMFVLADEFSREICYLPTKIILRHNNKL